MTSPSVTVIVPAHNEERFIGRCLRSVLAQTLERSRYEVIVVDDGSDDNTPKALAPYLDDIVLLANDANLGLPAALNRGIRAARGQFIVRVDADDWVLPEYLNVLSLCLRLNNAIDAVACDYQLVDERQNVVACMDCYRAPIGCAVMYRIEHLINIGLYDEAFLAREDEELRIRFGRRYAISRIPVPLYKYHLHGENLSADRSRMEAFRQLIIERHGIAAVAECDRPVSRHDGAVASAPAAADAAVAFVPWTRHDVRPMDGVSD